MTIHRKILVGSLWAVGMRWSIRLIGMASVVVLARVLRPEDFGIMAMAMLLVGALATFGELGVGSMVIRELEVSRSDLDTAWTLKLLQGLCIAALVALLAPLAAGHFHEPRVTPVVYLGAIALAVDAFENIGVVLLRKNLNFSADFRYQVIVKVIGTLVTIALALWLRNYWALAMAQPVVALANVGVSYAVSPFRPRLSLASYRRYFAFSMNMLLANVARFGYNKSDVFIVGSTGTSTQMGLYNVAADLSSMVPRELTSAVGRALYPSLAQQRRGEGDFVATFLQVVAWIAIACLPVGLGLWVVADDAVRTILGERWKDTVSLMRYLAIYGMLASLIDIMLGHVLLVTGHERRQTMFFWVRLTVLVACVLVGLRGGVDGIALGAMVSGFVMLAVGIGVLVSTLKMPLAGFVGVFWRPVLAASAMAGVVHVAATVSLPPLPRLILCVAVGALFYFFVLLLLWHIAGRPHGVEQIIFSAAARRRSRP